MESPSDSPLQLVARLLEPLEACLTPEIAQQIVELRADPESQARLGELADKANEGLLSTEEEQEYGACIEALDLIALVQAKARALLNNRNAAA